MSNRWVVFASGAIVGFLISLILTNFPQRFDEDQPAQRIEEPVLDPLADVVVPLNDRIKAKIRFYLHAGRKADLLESYKRSGAYLPMIQAIFAEYNLPQFLVYVPVLESRFLPNSRSRAGAVGLWQLMPAAAFDYGLKINRWIDERRDPEKSTIVAAEYLQFLYEKLGDWDLVLAAYNCGYTTLRRAMRRDRASQFWQLKRIPKETYAFVPKFYAILHIYADSEKYGVTLPQQSKPADHETIDIEATFSIDQIARLANIPPNLIKKYNPALIGDIAPSGKYSIRVPVGVKEHFLKQYNENPLDRVEITYTTYRVKKGDTLQKIARKFGTTVKEIKADNNLRSSRWINIGMKLRIASVTVIKESLLEETKEKIADSDLTRIPESNRLRFLYKAERNGLSLKTLARYYIVTTDELKSWNPWLQRDTLQKGEELSIYKPKQNVTFHKTRRGDSLWRLARKYHATVGNLKRWNQLRGSKIYPGNRLVVGLD
ncbi:MAG: LysM peptidoglycan-binding domain-containing protein [bacterium]